MGYGVDGRLPLAGNFWLMCGCLAWISNLVNLSYAVTTRIFGKATTKSSFEKRVLNEPGGYWLVIVNLPAIPEKTGGLPWSELSESRRSLT